MHAQMMDVSDVEDWRETYRLFPMGRYKKLAYVIVTMLTE
jgi:hypothetical protein